jgi:hypothetical protein
VENGRAFGSLDEVLLGRRGRSARRDAPLDAGAQTAEAGKHVLVEKPLTLTVAEGRGAVAAAEPAATRGVAQRSPTSAAPAHDRPGRARDRQLHYLATVNGEFVNGPLGSRMSEDDAMKLSTQQVDQPVLAVLEAVGWA